MLISQLDAQGSTLYKTVNGWSFGHSLHLKISTHLHIIMVMKTFEVYAKLHDSQRRFNRACDQILLLNTSLRGLRKRYNSASSSDSKTFRFPLRMRMMAIEGLVKTYYHYADMKRSEILKLQDEMRKLDTSGSEDDVITDDEL